MQRDDKDKPESLFSMYKKIYMLSTVGVQLVVSIMMGLGMGLMLDKWLGTKPWLMIVFIFFGVAAGFLNIYRMATKEGMD